MNALPQGYFEIGANRKAYFTLPPNPTGLGAGQYIAPRGAWSPGSGCCREAGTDARAPGRRPCRQSESTLDAAEWPAADPPMEANHSAIAAGSGEILEYN